MSGPPKSISGSPLPPVARLTWSEALGKRVREGASAEQAVSTYVKIEEAIEAGQLELAAQLVDYSMEEAKVVYVIYQVWTEGFLAWLRQEQADEEEVAAELDRLRRLLAFPDGELFEPAPRWDALGAAAGLLANRLRAFETNADTAVAAVRDLREGWRQLHDRGADSRSGPADLRCASASASRESRTATARARAVPPGALQAVRPAGARLRGTVYRNLYLTFEAMRGSSLRPSSEGDLEVEEDEDRYVIGFDPCGSGGRMQRGDQSRGHRRGRSRRTSSA